MILPFAYKSLSAQEKNNVRFVHEFGYTVLEIGQTAIVGYIKPCLLIAFKNSNDSKTVIFHYHPFSKCEDLIKIVKKAIDCTDSYQIQGRIFTTAAPDIWQMYFKTKFHTRSQREEIKHIKDRLLHGLNIQNREQIQAQIYTLSPKHLGNYEFAELNLFVDHNLTINNICTMKEDIFINGSALSLSERIQKASAVQIAYSNYAITKAFKGKLNQEEMNTYNTVPFVEITQSLEDYKQHNPDLLNLLQCSSFL